MKARSTIYRAKARGIEDATRDIENAVEWWKPDHDDAMCVREIEDLARECISIRDDLQNWVESCWSCATHGTVADFTSVNNELQEAFSIGQARFQSVRECIDEAGRRGYQLDNTREFNEAEKQITKMQSEFEEKWPSLNLQVLRQSMADYRAGRYRTAKDLFDEFQRRNSKRDPGTDRGLGSP